MLNRMSRYQVIYKKNSWKFNGLNLDLFLQPSKWKNDASYMIHCAKFLLQTKISPVNHILKDNLDKYFPKNPFNKSNYSYHK